MPDHCPYHLLETIPASFIIKLKIKKERNKRNKKTHQVINEPIHLYLIINTPIIITPPNPPLFYPVTTNLSKLYKNVNYEKEQTST